MATKIARATQSQFGSSASTAQISEFGSLAAGSPATYSGSTITPAIIQTLSNYLQGWFGAVIGANSPAMEDMNALFYLVTYQLGYILQEGIPEWDSGTEYFVGSFVQDGSGNVYVSLTNSNLNNALSSATNWKSYTAVIDLISANPSSGTYQSPYTMSASDSGKTFLVLSGNAAMTFNLPSPATVGLNFWFKIKDAGWNANTNNITLHRHSTENFENVAADYVAQANGGEWEIATDGTSWYLVGR